MLQQTLAETTIVGYHNYRVKVDCLNYIITIEVYHTIALHFSLDPHGLAL